MCFESIRRVHIIKYKKYLEVTPFCRKKPFAPNTINRKLSAVSSFFQFPLQREVIERNPAEFCKRPSRMVMNETLASSDREMKTLFDLIIEEAPSLHKASILLLFTTGMRQAELRSLKLSSFETIEGIRFMSYVGKGQKMNRAPIHPTTAHYLDEYQKWIAMIGRPLKDDDHFFQPTKNSHGGKLAKKLSHTALSYIVKKCARKIQ